MINKFRVLKVVKQPSRSTDQQVYSFLETNALCLSVHPTNQQSDSFIMEMPNFFCNFIHLNS